MSILRQFAEEIKREIQNEIAKVQAELNPPPVMQTHAMSQSPPKASTSPNKTEAGKKTKTRSTKKADKKNNVPGDIEKTVSPKREAGKIEFLGANATRTKPHHIVSSLNAASARNAIVLAEVLGPPVSRRRK